MPIPSAAGGTNRSPGPAGIASPIRKASADTPITTARKMATGKSGTSGIPTMEMQSSTMTGKRSSQQRKPTTKLRTGCSNMACPTARIRSGQTRKPRSPSR